MIDVKILPCAWAAALIGCLNRANRIVEHSQITHYTLMFAGLMYCTVRVWSFILTCSVFLRLLSPNWTWLLQIATIVFVAIAQLVQMSARRRICCFACLWTTHCLLLCFFSNCSQQCWRQFCCDDAVVSPSTANSGTTIASTANCRRDSTPYVSNDGLHQLQSATNDHQLQPCAADWTSKTSDKSTETTANTVRTIQADVIWSQTPSARTTWNHTKLCEGQNWAAWH